MHPDLGRIAQSPSRRNAGRGRARQSTPLQEGNAAHVAFTKSSSLKAMKNQTSEQTRERC